MLRHDPVTAVMVFRFSTDDGSSDEFAGRRVTVADDPKAEQGRTLVHATAWMMVAQGARLGCQVIYFVLIARVLGVHSFGALAASVALVSILVPFAAWGSGNVLVMDVVRSRAAFSVAFGNALLSIALSSLVLVPLVVGLGAALLGRVPALAILFLALADLCFGRLVDVAAPAFQAVEQLGAMTFATVLVPAARCLAVIFFAAGWTTHGLVAWTVFYLGGNVLAAGIALWQVIRRLGLPTFRPSSLRGKVKLGGYFAIGLSAATIYADIDKTMLGRLSTFDATGIYAAADRAIGMAFIPVGAMLAAAYPRFFRAGMSGIDGSTAYARRLLTPSVAYGVVAGAAMYLLAPLAPHVLGADFQGSVAAVRWLTPIPLLSALYYLPADALTGADAQGLRTVLQLLAAGLNVLLNFLLIPAHSWRGAAWSTIASLTFLAASLWLATVALRRFSSAATPSLRNAG